MKRENIYILCQVGGWGFLAVMSIIITHLAGSSVENPWWAPTLFCLFGILVSHLFRAYIKRHHWVGMSLVQLIPRVLIALQVFFFIMTPILIGISILVDPKNPDNYSAFTIISSWFNVNVLFGTWSLFYFFAHLLWNYKHAEIEKWKLEAQVRNAELAALKSQLNPHFMFNMLNSIRALIAEDPSRAQQVVTRLARLLRSSLGSGQEALVPLKEELRTVGDYLELEGIRLEDRLKWVLDTEPGMDSVQVPVMLVQTLVENGVKHGVSSLPEGGEIRVAARRDANHLSITVENSGQMKEEGSGTGIGLRNARDRLSLHYGPEAKLTLANQLDRVIALVQIPLEQSA